MSSPIRLLGLGRALGSLVAATALSAPCIAEETVPPMAPIIPITAEQLAGTGAKPTTLTGSYIEATRPPKEIRMGDGYQGDFIAGVMVIDGGGTYALEDYPGDEFVAVLRGEVTLTAAGSTAAQTFRTGEFFLVPKGWSGTWDMPVDYRELVVLSSAWSAALAGEAVATGVQTPGEVIRLDPIAAAASFEPVDMDGPHTKTLRDGKVHSATLHWGDYAVMVFDTPDGAKHEFTEYPGDEYVYVVSGTATLTDASGVSMTFKAGDHFIVTRAFKGTWDVSPGFRELIVLDRKHFEPVPTE